MVIEQEPKIPLPDDEVKRILRQFFELASEIHPFPVKEPKDPRHVAAGIAPPEVEDKREEIRQLAQSLIDCGNFSTFEDVDRAAGDLYESESDLQ